MFLHDKETGTLYPILATETQRYVGSRIHLMGSMIREGQFRPPTVWEPILIDRMEYFKEGFDYTTFNEVSRGKIAWESVKHYLPFPYYWWLSEKRFGKRYEIVDTPPSNADLLDRMTEKEE